MQGMTERPRAQGTSESSALLSISGAMGFLSISRTRLYELFASGELRSVKLGRRRLVPREELEAYVRRLVEAS